MTDTDIDWLRSLGYSQLSEEDAQSLLDTIHEELQVRVGARLSESVTHAQLVEFHKLRSGDVSFATHWVEREGIDPKKDETYRIMTENVQDCDEMRSRFCDWAATKWIEVSCPDYREVIAQCREQLEAELRDNASRVQRVTPAQPHK